jgi:hypothetical protein
MSKKKHNEKIESIKEDIINGANKLLNKKEGLSERDKSFNQFLLYVLADKYTISIKKENMDKWDKSSLKIMKKYIHILNILYEFDDKKREEIYNKSLEQINDSSLNENINEFKFLINKAKNDFIQYSKEKNIIYLKLDEILSGQKQNLFYIMDRYQINFSKIISEPDILKFIFFKIYRWKYINNNWKIDLKNYYSNFNDETCLNLVLLFFGELDEIKRLIYLSLIFNFDSIFKGKANYSKELLKRAIDETYKNINIKLIDDKNINSIIHNYLDNLKNGLSFTNNIIKTKSNNEDEKTSTETKSSNGNSNGEESFNINEINKLNSKNFEQDNDHNGVTTNNDSSNTLTLEKMKEELDEKWEKKFQVLQNKINILTDNKNEISKKVSSLENQVEDLKSELNTIEIRDQIRNLINSFSYILSEEDKEHLESKTIKRSEVFSNAFEKKFFQYNKTKKYHILKNLLVKACDLYDLGNIYAHTLYSKNYREKIDEFVNMNDIKNTYISHDKLLFLSLCDISKDYIEYSIEFVQNCLDNNFTKNFLRSGGDIYEDFLKNK